MKPSGCRSSSIAATFAVIAALLGTQRAPAMTVEEVEMTCPYDGSRFTATLQMSGTSFDRGLDFRLLGPIQSPSPLAVCPTNGFVFLKHKYSEEELEKLRPFILSDEYQALKREAPYYRAAWILDRTGAPPMPVSFTLLQATWEARRDPDRYASYATELVARLPTAVAQARNDTERTNLNLITGELLRRLSRFDEAERHFKTITNESDKSGNVAKIIAFQLDLIARRDAREHAWSEALKGRK